MPSPKTQYGIPIVKVVHARHPDDQNKAFCGQPHAAKFAKGVSSITCYRCKQKVAGHKQKWGK